MLGFALCYWLIDVRGYRRGWTLPMIFGTNAIVAFVVSGLLTSTLDVLHVGAANWHAWGYAHVFLPWLAPVHASLLYAVSILLLNCAVVGVLYRRRIFLRL